MDQIQLLKILEKDPRIQKQDLADLLATDVEGVEKEQKELEKEQIICGYHTVINWDKTNIDHCSAIIEVSAKPEREVGYDRIAERIAGFPEVTNLYLMSGRSEFMVFIEGRTMREVSDFVAQKLAPIEGVMSTVTCFLLKNYKVDGIILEEEKTEDERMIVEP